MHATATDWGPVLFATMVPTILAILAGLIHIGIRLGRTEQRISGLEHDVQEVSEEVRWLIHHLARMVGDGDHDRDR